MKDTRPVWAAIDLDNLAHNIREVRRVTNPQTMVCAVIKADGYGHGASAIAQTLYDNGADRFAVATLSEAKRLRRVVPHTPILILGYTPEGLVADIAESSLIQTIYSLEQAKAFHNYASSRSITLKVHLKIDTGMSRLGFLTNQAAIADILACYQLTGLDIEGVYTHFAKADEIDKTTTIQQVERYLTVVKAIENAGYQIPIKHVSNSAAIIDLPQYNFDMVRAGIMLYGLYPSPDVDHRTVNLKEVMSLKAKVSQVKIMPEAGGISYGHIYQAQANECIASLPLGYADGLTRLLTEKGDVILKGKRVPIVGRICMDQCMLSVPDGDVQRDDVVAIFGKHDGVFKSIDEVATAIGTINYEIVCMINKRVPRRYYRHGKCVAVVDDLLRLSTIDE